MSKLIDFYKHLTKDLVEVEKVGGKNIIFGENEFEFKFRDCKTGKFGSSLLKDSIDLFIQLFLFSVFCK